MKLHSTGQLLCFGCCWGLTKEQAGKRLQEVLACGKSVYGTKTSRVDLQDNGEISKTMVYYKRYEGQCYFFVETVTDNSKDPQTSRDNIQVDTLVYYWKGKP
jgi:hypothetical protein